MILLCLVSFICAPLYSALQKIVARIVVKTTIIITHAKIRLNRIIRKEKP